MRRAQQQQQHQGASAPGVVRVDQASPASTFRQLDDAFLQKQTKIWLGEVLHVRFDEDILVADLLGDGELLFQVSKVIWKRLLRKNKEQLKQSKVYIYERTSFGKSNGKYTPYPKVDSFLKICQILGLAGIDLFTPSDVVEKRNVREVCMCIRSLSKKAGMMHLNVPDFDVVTHTIAMPNYMVGVIRRSLEQPRCSSSCSSGYSPHANSESIFGQNDQQGDTHYDSDEAESSLYVLEPQENVGEDNLSERLQIGNAPKEQREGYGDSGHGKLEEKSVAEPVGSLDFGVMDADSADSAPFHDNQLCCSTHSSTDQCSRTRTTKCSMSSEESDSISSYLAFDSSKNDLDAPKVKVSERIHDEHDEPSHSSIQGNGKIFVDHPKKEGDDLLKDTSAMDQHCDAFICDRESVSSSSEEPRFGLNGESYSGLTPRNSTGGQLPAVSEDTTASRGLKHEISTKDHIDASRSEDELAKPLDTAEHNNGNAQRNEDDPPKSGKGVLKSVAGGITLVGAVFFIAHLRRSKGRIFTAILPPLSEKSIQSDSRTTNVDKRKAAELYPGGWLKV